MFPRVKREYETSRVEQLVPGTHPDRRPLHIHQSVFCPHWCNPATGGSTAFCLPWLHAPQQTQPAPQHRFVSHSSVLRPWFTIWFDQCGICVNEDHLWTRSTKTGFLWKLIHKPIFWCLSYSSLFSAGANSPEFCCMLWALLDSCVFGSKPFWPVY